MFTQDSRLFKIDIEKYPDGMNPCDLCKAVIEFLCEQNLTVQTAERFVGGAAIEGVVCRFIFSNREAIQHLTSALRYLRCNWGTVPSLDQFEALSQQASEPSHDARYIAARKIQLLAKLVASRSSYKPDHIDFDFALLAVKSEREDFWRYAREGGFFKDCGGGASWQGQGPLGRLVCRAEEILKEERANDHGA